jgi:tRNA nucleotidyltransferase (CCA-adding enzyme)
MNFSDFNIPEPVQQLIQKLHENSYEGWIVGGALRTLILGQAPKDWDIATSATPDQVKKVFSHTIDTGIAYGTVTVVIDDFHMQVTTFRKESAYENHRKPSVAYCQSLIDDLSRRDFTMNAIAYNPYLNQMEDPYSGIQDIEQQWIKAVGNPEVRFEEDALRILRALRFQSQLGFAIDGETMTAMQAKAHLLSKLSRERIGEEWTKWLVGDHFSMTQHTVREMNFFQIFEKAPSDELMKKWDSIPATSSFLEFRLATFFYLYFNQDKPSDRISNSLNSLKSLKYGQNLISKVIHFIEFLSLPMNLELKEERLAITKKALEIDLENAIILTDFLLQQSVDKVLVLKLKNKLNLLRDTGYHHKVGSIAVSGEDVMKILNLPPGPQIKTVLNDIQNHVLENPHLNTFEALKDYLLKNHR